MGKKSKKIKAKAQPLAVDTVKELECPEDGWAVELIFADKEAKKAPESASAQLRVATAACQLRQWETCQDACRIGLTLEIEDDDVNHELIYYRKRANTEVLAEKGSQKNLTSVQDIFRKIMEEDWAIDYIRGIIMEDELDTDYIRGTHPTFDNLNFLQYAAMRGDLPLLEKLAALGAALDFPVLDPEELQRLKRDGPGQVPERSTALLLICSLLAVYTQMGMTPKTMTRVMKKEDRGREECAIQLVYLGADLNRALARPNHIPNDPEAAHFMNDRLGLYGKTIQELAALSGRSKLLEAIQDMETRELQLSNAHCRCGSRLPWLQCHAGLKDDHNPIYVEPEPIYGKHFRYRYSPLAPCPCNHKGKPYWYCCWEQTADARYKDDSMGELSYSRARRLDNTPSVSFQLRASRDGSDHSFRFLENTPNVEMKVSHANHFRREGMSYLDASIHPNSTMDTWDAEVYAGCIERLDKDKFFFWNDVHWPLDKTELKARVKEWNAALEQYCHDAGLNGSERKAVVHKHSASPCAPCANPGCKSMEEKAKEFLRCSRCKRVAYCSVKCQRKAWKDHKNGCST